VQGRGAAAVGSRDGENRWCFNGRRTGFVGIDGGSHAAGSTGDHRRGLRAPRVCCFLVAGAIVVRAFWPTTFDHPPKPAALREVVLVMDPPEAKLKVIDTIIDAYDRNEVVIAKKILAFKLAFVLTALATVLMGFGIIVQIACQTIQPSWWPWLGSSC
jgi:hypothetical protein